MAYSVYFKYGGKKYKLPVNPEEIKRTRNLNVETYQVLGSDVYKRQGQRVQGKGDGPGNGIGKYCKGIRP